MNEIAWPTVAQADDFVRFQKANTMLKSIFVATALSVAFLTPAFAMDEMKCDDATMMMMEKDAGKMTNEKAKQDVMADMMKAKMSMKDKKMDECMMHLDAAKKHMM